MSLYDIITSLQKKPDSTKRAIIAGATIISGIVLLSVWGMLFKYEIEQSATFLAPLAIEDEMTKDQSSRYNENILSPLASLRQGITLVFSDVQKQLSRAVDEEGSSKEEGRIHEEGAPSGAWPLPVRN